MDNMENIKWIKVDPETMDVYNVDKDYVRIPAHIAEKISRGVLGFSKCASGGRIRFATNTNQMYVRCELDVSWGQGFDLYKMVNGREHFKATFRRDECIIHSGVFMSRKAEGHLQDSKEEHFYTMNFPTFGLIKSIEIGIDEDATFKAGAEYVNKKPVVFYGSSITNGAQASRPGMTYTALISQKYNLNYLNMGFAGSARGEEAMAEYLANLEMSAFVCGYDHNAYEDGHLEKTHLALYKKIREKHPDIPYIMLTRPDYFSNVSLAEQRAGVIYENYEYAKSIGDKNVYFIHGKTFFEGEYYTNCTNDGCHPNDVGFMRMACKIGPVIAKAMGLEVDFLHDTYLDERKSDKDDAKFTQPVDRCAM